MFNKNNRFYKYFIPSLTIFILAVFLLTFSVNVNAAVSDYYPMNQNPSGYFNDSEIDLIDTVLDGSNNFYFVTLNYQTSTVWRIYAITQLKSDNNGQVSFIGTPSNNGQTFSIQQSINNVSYAVYKIEYNRTSDTYSKTSETVQLNRFQNLSSQLYNSNANYVSNFRLYSSSNVATQFIVLDFIGGGIFLPDLGHAVGPSDQIPSFGYPIGMHPTSAPNVPSFTQPSLTTAPSIDTTDIKSVVQSIFNLLSWILTSIVSYLLSFINVVIDWFTFLANLLLWVATYFIDLYNAFVDWMYRLYTALFEPIYNFLKGFWKFLFDDDSQTSIFDLILDFKDLVSTWFSNFFSNLENTYSLIQGYFEDLQSYFSKVVLFFTSLVALGSDSSGEFAMGTLINNLFLPNPAEVAYILFQNDEFDVFSTTTTILQAFPVLFNQLISTAPSATIHIPSLIYHGQQIGDFDVDFSWYAPYKIYVDVILNAFLIIGYLYWLFITFGSHLRGHFMDYEPNNPDSNARIFRG